MTAKKIAIILGHPSADAGTMCRALAEAYGQGAREAGHEAVLIDVGAMVLPFLEKRSGYEALPDCVRQAQVTLAAADHWVLVYPLWLGSMPAKLKSFLEWVLSPGFAYEYVKPGSPRMLLAGKTARIIVTMGMPAFAYRWFFMAHSVKALERNILKFIGIKPVRHTFLGMVETVSDTTRRRWLVQVAALGKRAG